MSQKVECISCNKERRLPRTRCCSTYLESEWLQPPMVITVAHPTWPEEVVLKLAREKRSIRELPDKLIRLLVYTTCMTKIQLQLEREAVEEEQKKATEGDSKGGEELMESQDEESQTRKEEAQSKECQKE